MKVTGVVIGGGSRGSTYSTYATQFPDEFQVRLRVSVMYTCFYSNRLTSLWDNYQSRCTSLCSCGLSVGVFGIILAFVSHIVVALFCYINGICISGGLHWDEECYLICHGWHATVCFHTVCYKFFGTMYVRGGEPMARVQMLWARGIPSVPPPQHFKHINTLEIHIFFYEGFYLNTFLKHLWNNVLF